MNTSDSNSPQAQRPADPSTSTRGTVMANQRVSLMAARRGEQHVPTPQTPTQQTPTKAAVAAHREYSTTGENTPLVNKSLKIEPVTPPHVVLCSAADPLKGIAMLRPTVLGTTASTILRSHSNGRGTSTPRGHQPLQIASPAVVSPPRHLDTNHLVIRPLDLAPSPHSTNSGPTDSHQGHQTLFISQFGSVVSSRYISRAGSPTFDRSGSTGEMLHTPHRIEAAIRDNGDEGNVHSYSGSPLADSQILPNGRRIGPDSIPPTPPVLHDKQLSLCGIDPPQTLVAEEEEPQPPTARAEVVKTEEMSHSASLSSFLSGRVTKPLQSESKATSPLLPPQAIAIAAPSTRKSLSKKASVAAVGRIASHLQKQQQVRREEQEHRRIGRISSGAFDSNECSLRSVDSPLKMGASAAHLTAKSTSDNSPLKHHVPGIVAGAIMCKTQQTRSPIQVAKEVHAEAQTVTVPKLAIPNATEDPCTDKRGSSVVPSYGYVPDFPSPRALCSTESEAREGCDILLKTDCVVLPLWPQQSYCLVEVIGIHSPTSVKYNKVPSSFVKDGVELQ